MDSIYSIANALGNPKKNGEGWMCTCPLHDDKKPSLSVKKGDKTSVIFKCFAGCDGGDVLKFCKDKGILPELIPIRAIAKYEVCRYRYINSDGELLFEKIRYEPKDFRIVNPDGYGDGGHKGALYNAQNLHNLAGEIVYIVEGEKDVDTLSSLGLLATTSGSASGWPNKHNHIFSGAHIRIIPDNDEPGIKYGLKIQQSLQSIAASIIIKVCPDGHKDISDWVAYGATKECINRLFHNNLIWEMPYFKILPHATITPYPGVMEAVVKQILSIANKPQPELTILSALIGMSAAIGGNYKLPGGGRLNLYGIGISGTGTGKDKPMSAGVCLASMGGANIIGMPGSGAALEDALSETGTKLLLNIDEIAHFVSAMNDDKQTHMASLSGNLLKLFTASRGSYITRKLANSSHNEQKNCINPCVSLLGFACPEKLGAAFGGSSNIDDGLMGRILFVNGRDYVKPRRDSGELNFHHDIYDIGKRINCSHEIILSFTYGADQKLDELIQHFDSSSVSSSNPFAKNLKTRSFEKCERIAAVLAVWDCPDNPVIKLDHVLWAEEFINYSDDAIIKFTDKHLHGGHVQADAEKILTVIEKFRSGEIKPTTLSQKELLKFPGNFPRSCILKGTKLSKKEFDSGIDHLIDLEKVTIGIKELNGQSFKMIFC